MIYLLFVGLLQFRGNLMSNLSLYYILPVKLTCVTVGLVMYILLMLFILY